MRVLVLTAMYPSAERPSLGTFVREQVESLRRAGIEIEVMRIEGTGTLRKYLRAGGALRARLRAERFDLVHAHYGLAGMSARMQASCPVVVTYHGSDLLGEVAANGRYTWEGRFKVFLGQLAGLLATRCIVVSDLLQTRLWRRDAAVIPMGVDLDLFRPLPQDEARRGLGLASGRRYVLFLADPAVGVKRHDIARAAVDRLAASYPAVELLAVSGVPHDRVPMYMAACDVLVLTSNHEASPCAIKEALACNLPIVAVPVGDIPQRIAGVAGCHLCDRSPDDVAAKLALALATGDRSDGRRKVEAISLERIARRTIGVYERALGLASSKEQIDAA
jgi:glycosyltransferase involved in cell wall biosynthesis